MAPSNRKRRVLRPLALALICATAIEVLLHGLLFIRHDAPALEFVHNKLILFVVAWIAALVLVAGVLNYALPESEPRCNEYGCVHEP